MATNKDTVKQPTDSIYPEATKNLSQAEAAQELNFKNARETAQANVEAENENTDKGAVFEDDHTAGDEIPAQPETTLTTNPEQVKNEEDGDSSEKAEDLSTEEADEKNTAQAKEDAAKEAEAQKKAQASK